jgi:hypothetical protein
MFRSGGISDLRMNKQSLYQRDAMKRFTMESQFLAGLNPSKR